MLFEGQRLGFRYRLGTQWVDALCGVDLEVREGEFLGLVGPSGSGKTTLLNLLGLIEPVQEGTLRFFGRDMKSLAEKERNSIRRFELGFIFQFFELFPVLSAQENVEYFLQRMGLRRGEIRRRALEALQAVGLAEHARKRPLEMSGGQRQRVAIARALAKRPRVVIADEPTASLDQATGAQIIDLLQKLNRGEGVSILISSHDPMVQTRMDRLIHLRDGRVTETQGGLK